MRKISAASETQSELPASRLRVLRRDIRARELVVRWYSRRSAVNRDDWRTFPLLALRSEFEDSEGVSLHFILEFACNNARGIFDGIDPHGIHRCVFRVQVLRAQVSGGSRELIGPRIHFVSGMSAPPPDLENDFPKFGDRAEIPRVSTRRYSGTEIFRNSRFLDCSPSLPINLSINHKYHGVCGIRIPDGRSEEETPR